jgi:hypothetical protein
MHERDWMCWQCGYHMNAASEIGGEAEPSEGDISICFNCGALFSRHGSAWQPMTTLEATSLAPQERAVVERARALRARVVKTNMAKPPGRA